MSMAYRLVIWGAAAPFVLCCAGTAVQSSNFSCIERVSERLCLWASLREHFMLESSQRS